MWPQVPSDFNTLSIDELRAFISAVRKAAIPAFSTGDATEKATATEFLGHKATAEAALAGKVTAAALADEDAADEAAAAEAAAAVAQKASTDAAAAAAAEKATADQAAADEADDAAAADEEAATAAATLAAAEAAGRKPSTSFGIEGTPAPAGTPVISTRMRPDQLVASSEVSGKKAGDSFSSFSEVAAALLARSKSIRSDSESQFEVARIVGNYDKSRQLRTVGDNGEAVIKDNLRMFEPEQLTAAFCAPATPVYDLACANTMRRPVFDSLPGYQLVDRMRVSVMPSPTLADITGGTGIWDDTDDDDPNARKLCQTITCGSPTTYKMYGVWRCLTVKNLLAMSYPELVESWLNRLGAAHSRLAEIQLLDAMGAGAVDLNAAQLGYGASVTITSTILQYLALYQETQRWDITANMEAWLPRWVRAAIRMDIMRRRNTSGTNINVVTDAEIDTMFRNVGVNPHWFIDTPSWAVAVPAVASGSNLNLLPQSVQVLIAPPGKFAVMDRGELAIGVTGNHVYRDNASNAQNQFTMFWENFEGVVSTTSCPAHILDIAICINGAQADDVLLNCQGGDEIGYQS